MKVFQKIVGFVVKTDILEVELFCRFVPELGGPRRFLGSQA